MKHIFCFGVFVVVSLAGFGQDAGVWSKRAAAAWFKKKVWLGAAAGAAGAGKPVGRRAAGTGTASGGAGTAGDGASSGAGSASAGAGGAAIAGAGSRPGRGTTAGKGSDTGSGATRAGTVISGAGAGAAREIRYDAFGRVIEEEDAAADTASHAVKKMANPLQPHASIDQVKLATQYHKNQDAWDRAFAYLRETDLEALPAGKFPVGDLIVLVTEGKARKIDTTKWEGHTVYADIHYILRGRENIGRAEIAALKPVTEYDPVRDIRFYEGKGKYFLAEPGMFFVFFPGEGHRPNLRAGEGEEKRVVVKVKVIQ